MNFFDFSTFSFSMHDFFDTIKSYASVYVLPIRMITSSALLVGFSFRKFRAMAGFINSQPTGKV
jgi:hypothetical protein